MKNIFIFILLLCIGFLAARATDLPYGSDTLPYAESRANVVARVEQAAAEQSPNKIASRYLLRLGGFLRGSVDQTVSVVVPKGIDVEDHDPQKFVGTLVF